MAKSLVSTYKTIVLQSYKDVLYFVYCRITIKRLSSSTIAFPTSDGNNDGTTDLPLSTNQFGQTILDQETITVHWQQKLFSQVFN